MKQILLISASAITIGLSAQKHIRPNIVIILADDLGYGDVSAMGSATINTPNFDRLANQGILFTNGYATSATSTPSRYAMFTGMYPWKNKETKILAGDAPLIINEKQYTLPKMLQEAGYITGAIGKWHLGMGAGNVDWNKKVTPGANEIGFDYSCLIAATNDRVPSVYVENGKVVGLNQDDPIYVSYKKNFDNEPTALTHPELLRMNWSVGHNQSVHNGIPRIGYQKGGKSALWKDEDMAEYFTEKAKVFIDSVQNKSFFLYFGLHQPHVPRTPNSRFVGSSGMGPRGDAILEADWSVGELIKHLENKGLLENTIIIFSSDNGPVLDDGYQDQAVELLGNHKPTGQLRGGKYSLFEAGTRVPFFVYWKNKIKPSVSNALVCHIDFMASFAALINKPLKSKLDSENILPTLLGQSDKGRKELVIEAEGRLAYRHGDYVFIPSYTGMERNYTGNELGNLPNKSLFNLKKDISQTKNISTKKKMLTMKMERRFIVITRNHNLSN
jgi:arylsulfatase A-like enzyme